jgi:hypothetical protein
MRFRGVLPLHLPYRQSMSWTLFLARISENSSRVRSATCCNSCACRLPKKRTERPCELASAGTRFCMASNLGCARKKEEKKRKKKRKRKGEREMHEQKEKRSLWSATCISPGHFEEQLQAPAATVRRETRPPPPWSEKKKITVIFVVRLSDKSRQEETK